VTGELERASDVMKIYKDHIVFIVPILLLIQIATAQQQIPAGSSLVTSPRPLADAARSLQETYGKVVTYEEPILTWRGELQTKPGRNPEAKVGAISNAAEFLKINKLHRRWDRFSALNALRFPFSKTMRYRCPSGPAAIAIMVPNSPSWFVPTIKTESPTLNSSDSLLMTCHFYSMSWKTIGRF